MKPLRRRLRAPGAARRSPAGSSPKRLAARKRRGTFLLGVGAQKAGTTWLHHYLARSPQCERGYRKEYHVLDSAFLRDEPWRARNLDMAQEELDRLRRGEDADPVHLHRASMIADSRFYYDYFAGLLRTPGVRLTADVTPEYAFLTPERYAEIRRAFAKRGVRTAAIFLMRDPVDRLWSQIRMQEGRDPSRFPEPAHKMIEKLYADPRYDKWSRYETTIRNLDEVFHPRNLYYGFYEELFDEDEVRAICDFVGIDFRTPEFERRANVSAAKGVDALPEDVVADVARHLRDTYESVAARFPDKDLRALWPSSRFVL